MFSINNVYNLSTYPSKIKAKLELEEVAGMETFPEDISFLGCEAMSTILHPLYSHLKYSAGDLETQVTHACMS